jgi:hypothetical protein
MNNQIYQSFQNVQDVFLNAGNSFLSTLAEYLPVIFGAILLLIIGKIVAMLLKTATVRVLNWVGFTKTAQDSGIDETFKSVGLNKTVTDLVSTLVYWIVFLLFISAAFETLGLQVVVETLNVLVTYLPSVIIGAVTIILTIIFARTIKGLIAASLQHANFDHGHIVAAIAEVMVILFGASIAASQIGFDVRIITTNITIIVAGIVAIFVVAMGTGARNMMANMIGSYYTKQLYKDGDKVQIAGHKGTVKSINRMAVVLETSGGDISVPNDVVLKNGSSE